MKSGLITLVVLFSFLACALADVNGIVQQCYGNSWIIVDENSIEVEKQWGDDGGVDDDNTTMTTGKKKVFKNHRTYTSDDMPWIPNLNAATMAYLSQRGTFDGAKAAFPFKTPLPDDDWVEVRKYGTTSGGVRIKKPTNIDDLKTAAGVALGIQTPAEIRDDDSLAAIRDVDLLDDRETVYLTTPQQEMHMDEDTDDDTPAKTIVVRKYGQTIGGHKVEVPDFMDDLKQKGAQALGIPDPAQIRSDDGTLAVIDDVDLLNDGDVVVLTNTAAEHDINTLDDKTDKFVVVRKFGAPRGGHKIRVPNNVDELKREAAEVLGVHDPREIREVDTLASIHDIDAIHDNDVLFLTDLQDEQNSYST